MLYGNIFLLNMGRKIYFLTTNKYIKDDNF